MTEKSLLIVGPGNSFTSEIIDVFVAEDFSIGLIGRNEAKLARLSKARYVGWVADVSDEAEVEEAITEMGEMMPPWNTIIYNVKDSPRGDALSVDSNDLLESLSSNVIGALHVGRAALKFWPRTDEANIILSGGGYKDKPHPEKVGLSISKGALHTLGLIMRESFEPHGVSVHEIVIDGEVGSTIKPRNLARRYFTQVNNLPG